MNPSTASTPFAPLASSVDDALKQIFGFEAFRQGQREVIDTVVEGRDTVVVMPTGSGKSLCYMLPACVMPGLVVAVSPLIALMKDQADALEAFGIPATFINSSLSYDEQRARLAAIRSGAFKIVLVAPERFKSGHFMRAIEGLPIGLFAIDEAHCISAWGHDFRPDYLTLDRVREALGTPPTLALTATATPRVQTDMARQLALDEPKIVVSGFERPNLFFEVYSARTKKEKFDRMAAALTTVDDGSTVIYCATRKQVEELGRKLKSAGHHPALYHAGLSDKHREEIQDAFMAGDAPLLIATNAFGMGVDKSDVRLIVHFNIPGSVEAYYQEAGRAGRDGEPAHCLLLYNRNDRGIHEFFIDNSHPPRQVIIRVWRYLQKQGLGTHSLDSDQIADHLTRGADRTHPWAVESALRLLERGGHIAFGSRSGMPWIDVIDQGRPRDLRVDFEELDRNREIEERHLDHISRYAMGGTCRQTYLVRYFSDAAADLEACGHCDVCCGAPGYGGQTQREKILCDDDPQILLKKILSGVARCRGRWGTHVVAGTLRGSRAKKILNAGLDRLSTYGLLSELRQKDLVLLLDVFTQIGLLRQNEYGSLSLTDEGRTLMTSDDSLPKNVADTLQRYLISSADAADRPAQRLQGRRRPALGDELNETYLRTLALAGDGLDYRQIAERRGLTPASVLRHFLVLAATGHALNLDAHKEGRILPELRHLTADWNYGDALAPLKDRLSVECDYNTLKLHLAIILVERQQEAAEELARA